MFNPATASTMSGGIPGVPGPFAGQSPSIPIMQLPLPLGPLTGAEYFPLVQFGITCRSNIIGALTAAANIKIPQPMTTEQLAVTAPNTLANLSFPPTTSIMIFVNGIAFFPVGLPAGSPGFPTGSPVDFSYSGTTITWLNSAYTLLPGTRVVAQYTHA